MGRDQKAQRNVNHLVEQLSRGNSNPGIIPLFFKYPDITG
jgi:hypothetical protein